MRAKIIGAPSQRGSQIRPAYVPNEQGVSSEHGVWVDRVFLEIKDQDGDGLDGVTWSFQHLEAQARKLERVSIRHRNKRILRLGAATQINGGAAAVAQFQMPGNKIGVEVCQKDMADAETQFLCVRHILLDISLRVD